MKTSKSNIRDLLRSLLANWRMIYAFLVDELKRWWSWQTYELFFIFFLLRSSMFSFNQNDRISFFSLEFLLFTILSMCLHIIFESVWVSCLLFIVILFVVFYILYIFILHIILFKFYFYLLLLICFYLSLYNITGEKYFCVIV